MGFESGFNPSNKPEAGDSASEKLREMCKDELETILSSLDSEFGRININKAILRVVTRPEERSVALSVLPESKKLIQELEQLEDRFTLGPVNDALISINYSRGKDPFGLNE